jgi:2-polyprenyl-3-methyl-5-hydroxy-6-metoxy-1,4-benzoquinol methylase
MDKAGKKYWDNSWASVQLPAPVEPHNTKLRNYVIQRFHRFFCDVFSGIDTNNKSLLEVGCARSVWLPYFAKEFGFKVTGIDYSEIGCEQETKLLLAEGINGRIVCSDFFVPPEDMIEKFDVVISFGVMEHFENTSVCALALSEFLKPQGRLITIIPNMCGLVGYLQRLFNKRVYDIHVPLSDEDLSLAHEKAGLKVIFSKYFIPLNFGVVNLENLPNKVFYYLYKILLGILNRIAMFFWLLERKNLILPENEKLSPYIVCVSQKETSDK